jgi:glycosyltransferase involved in cell wall biosynthesis
VTILVVVPTYATPADMLSRCVDSLLKQTFTDICLLVLGDGEEPNVHPHDSRMIVHTLSQNRGRYFADAVAQRATPFDWYAPHDADDYSEHNRLEDLWQYRDVGDGVVWSDHINHHNGGTARAIFPRALRPVGPSQKRQGCHLGLYRIDRLRATGMYHPDFRVHYDSLHNSLIKMTGQVAVSPRALYHRTKWSGSLTMAPDTKLSGPYRRAAAAKCKPIYDAAYAAYKAGEPERVAEVVTATIDPATLDAVQAEAERLSKELS